MDAFLEWKTSLGRESEELPVAAQINDLAERLPHIKRDSIVLGVYLRQDAAFGGHRAIVGYGSLVAVLVK